VTGGVARSPWLTCPHGPGSGMTPPTGEQGRTVWQRVGASGQLESSSELLKGGTTASQATRGRTLDGGEEWHTE
jgi:hypothetical protein